MDNHRLKQCVKLLDLMYSGCRSDAKAQAKAIGVKKRSVFTYRRIIKEARMLRHDPDAGAGGGPHFDLRRLKHCDQLLELEYSGYRGEVHELARTLRVSEPTLFRELRLIEEATARPTTLIPRRKKKTKSRKHI